MTDVDNWLSAFASAANAPTLGTDDQDLILALAAVAARASQRSAAPLTCWIASAAGLSPAAALELARSLRVESSEPEPGDDL